MLSWLPWSPLVPDSIIEEVASSFRCEVRFGISVGAPAIRREVREGFHPKKEGARLFAGKGSRETGRKGKV